MQTTFNRNAHPVSTRPRRRVPAGLKGRLFDRANELHSIARRIERRTWEIDRVAHVGLNVPPHDKHQEVAIELLLKEQNALQRESERLGRLLVECCHAVGRDNQ